jgi:hypothetical protein
LKPAPLPIAATTAPEMIGPTPGMLMSLGNPHPAWPALRSLGADIPCSDLRPQRAVRPYCHFRKRG